MKYFTWDKMLRKDPQYLIAITGRGSGKSTDMCRQLIKNYEKDGSMFVLIRRRSRLKRCMKMNMCMHFTISAPWHLCIS